MRVETSNFPAKDRKKKGVSMATQTKKTPLAVKSPIRSTQIRSVYLYDWWLIKVQCHFNHWRLGLGGFSSRLNLGTRVFCSSAITTRHDHVTLETEDGITLIFSGVINRSRTLQNGFAPEVCSYFVNGFPYNWEEYADKSSCEESINKGLDGRPTFPTSFDNLPATGVRDLLMISTGHELCAIARNIFKDILPNCGDNSPSSPCEPSVNLNNDILPNCGDNSPSSPCEPSVNLNNDILPNGGDNSPSSPREPSVNLNNKNANQETPRSVRSIEDERNNHVSISLATPKKRKNTPITVEAVSSSRRVATRSMTRERNLKNNEFLKCNLAVSVPESKSSAGKNEDTFNDKNAQQGIVADTTHKSAVGHDDTLLSSAVVLEKPSEPINGCTTSEPSRRKSVRILAKKC